MLVVWCCILAGCSRRSADVTVTWTIDPPRPAAGAEIVVQLSVRNRDGTPSTGEMVKALEPRPVFLQYVERIAARPALQKVLKGA